MNDKPKSIWTNPRKMPGGMAGWLAAVACLAFLISLLAVILMDRAQWQEDWPLVGAATAVAAIVALLLCAVRWLAHWRNLKRALFVLACFATLTALFYTEEDWRGWRAWTRFKQQWEPKGEHFDLAGLVPPPVPDDQNFALSPIAFSSYGNLFTRQGKPIPYEQRDASFVDRMQLDLAHNNDEPTNGAGDRVRGRFINLAAWQGYYRDLAAKTNEFPVPARPQSPAADVLLALSKYDAVLEELRAASQLPASRFPLTYDNESPAAILLPHLAPLKICALCLRLRSAAELQNGQSDKALDDVRLGLQLAGKIRTEPFTISQLVRLAMVQIMLQPVWEGLAGHRWSDAQLAALEGELARFDFAADYQRCMRGELAMVSTETERLRRHPEDLGDSSGEPSAEGDYYGPKLPGGFLAWLIPAGWFYQNEFRCARMMLEDYVPVADVAQGTFSPGMVRRCKASVAAVFKSPSPFNVLERLVLPELYKAARRFAYGQASVNLARTAIALERYRLAHGEFPESLDALAPQFIAKVPHDVIGGQPLKYRREANGQFVLYSVGWNETDDGGTVVFKKGPAPGEERPTAGLDLDQGDWVWRYPQE
jgi:hypothetical protein